MKPDPIDALFLSLGLIGAAFVAVSVLAWIVRPIIAWSERHNRRDIY